MDTLGGYFGWYFGGCTRCVTSTTDNEQYKNRGSRVLNVSECPSVLTTFFFFVLVVLVVLFILVVLWQALVIVQRTWSYLEPLFIGSAEVKRELPDDTARFAKIDVDTKNILKSCGEIGNVLRACTQDGLLDTLERLQGEWVYMLVVLVVLVVELPMPANACQCLPITSNHFPCNRQTT